MVRTMSARLRRSFADHLDTAFLVRRRGVAQRRLLMVASLFQSVLLVGLTIYVGIEEPAQSHAAGPALAILALLTAGYVGYATLSGVGRQDNDRAASNEPRTEPVQFARFKEQISHELRTPLNAVIGFSEMMQRELLGPVGNERYREYAAHIRESAEHFQNATEKTLELAAMLGAPASAEQHDVQLSAILAGRRASCTEATTVRCNLAGVQQALECLEDGTGQLAAASPTARASISTKVERDGASIVIIVATQKGGTALALPETLPGFDLNLLLAGLHLEAAGGHLEVEMPNAGTWAAVIHLTRREPLQRPFSVTWTRAQAATAARHERRPSGMPGR